MTAPAHQTFLRRWGWVFVGIVVAVAMVVLLAPAASSDPDGLDRVSGDKGFHTEAKDSPYQILPDYTIPGVDNEWATVVLSGLTGVGIVLVLTLGVGFGLQRLRGAGRPHLDG